MEYVVIDLECTCWDHNDPHRDDHETIEIGAVFLDKDFNKLGQYHKYTWPKHNQTISEYCTDLTGITRSTLNRYAVSFYVAMISLSKHMRSLSDTDPILCSWGYFDKKQLEKDCLAWKCQYPFSDKHINIKQLFLDKHNRKRIGLQKAVRMAGLRFNGSPHSAIDDANMTVEIFRQLQKVEV